MESTSAVAYNEAEPSNSLKTGVSEVIIGDQPKVTYGKVNPERARKIMEEHVVGGKVLSEFTIPA